MDGLRTLLKVAKEKPDLLILGLNGKAREPAHRVRRHSRQMGLNEPIALGGALREWGPSVRTSSSKGVPSPWLVVAVKSAERTRRTADEGSDQQ
jgi:hypothetical protein